MLTLQVILSGVCGTDLHLIEGVHTYTQTNIDLCLHLALYLYERTDTNI
jgi:threonine dehydrogenase-like Zn-dependent dehydrogenase